MARTGRPPVEGKKKGEVVIFRTTDEMKELIKARSEYLGLSISDYIAKCINADLDAPMDISKIK